ncbi:MAG TPA: ATP-binding cassette domain-containing protein [Chthoniobacterales bacterium]
MLSLQNVSLHAGEQTLLADVSLRFPSGHLAAIVGPSGCGKTTLLRLIAGLREPDAGDIVWNGRSLLHGEDFHPAELGYVPQFAIAYDALTVAESVETALRLRVAGLNAEQVKERLYSVLCETGLDEIADRRVKVLSGGQKRRLALALEMVTSPRVLLCDEVLSGLDPKSETEILELLHTLSRDGERLVINVTHSAQELELYDSVCVLKGGYAAYHGPPQHLTHYFDVTSNEHVFDRLDNRSAEKWHSSWQKHAEAYAFQPLEKNHEPNGGVDQVLTPSAFTQFRIVAARRWKLWTRDRSHIALQLALLFGFPCLVAVFALGGLPQIQNLNPRFEANIVKQLSEANAWIQQASRDGSLISGLVMFQVILLTLMGSNNGAREIAAERDIFEKEKLAGLRPSAYLAGKLVLLGGLVLAQSIWMAAFVSVVCGFPGSLPVQMTLLALVNAAVTAISLALSATLRTAEQASLAAIYFVGFQLPLSGAFLVLPEWMAGGVKPFIAAYWGWSGYLQTLRETNYYTVLQSVIQTTLAGIPASVWFLTSQIVAGIFIAYIGCRRNQWS